MYGKTNAVFDRKRTEDRGRKTECVEKRDDALASALAAALRSKSQLGNALASALAAVLRSKSQLGNAFH
jgi:hypothetical protein